MFSMGYYSSPFLLTMAYRRDWFTSQGLVTVFEILAGFGCLYTTAMCMRSVGRGLNPVYRQFLDDLRDATAPEASPDSRAKMTGYDFDFRWWPIKYTVTQDKRAALNFIPHAEQVDTGIGKYILLLFGNK